MIYLYSISGVTLGAILLYIAASKVLFHATVWKLKSELAQAKYNERRSHAQMRKMRKERNKFAIELIRYRSFKHRFTDLVKSTQRKKHDP